MGRLFRKMWIWSVILATVPFVVMGLWANFSWLKSQGGIYGALMSVGIGYAIANEYRKQHDNPKVADAWIDVGWILFAVGGGILVFGGIKYTTLGFEERDAVALILVATGYRLVKSVGGLRDEKTKARQAKSTISPRES